MKLKFQRSIPVRYKTGICVVGGGPAGISAAVTAAQTGSPVLLMEGQGCFGGAASNSFVPAFMQFGDGKHFLAGGFAQQVYRFCAEYEGCVCDTYTGIPLEPLRRFYDACMAESGADFRFFSSLVDVEVEHGRVTRGIFHSKSGLFAVQADLFIDATGDGDLCALAGNPWSMGDESGETMPATLCSLWHGIDWTNAVNQTKELEPAIDSGLFHQPDRHHSGLFRTGVDTAGANVGHAFACNGLDESDLTRAMVDGRKMIPEYEIYYRDWLGEGFREARAMLSAPMLGVRETRRIHGRYCLNLDDYWNRASFEDEIGRNAYPLDIHPSSGDSGAYQTFVQQHKGGAYGIGESYGIPYGCLVPNQLDNVLMAGRCISVQRELQSSVRVMPACFLTGQAAGAAASLCLQEHCAPSQIDIQKLRSELREMGTWLPMSQTEKDAAEKECTNGNSRCAGRE